jgi:hypothetical protein
MGVGGEELRSARRQFRAKTYTLYAQHTRPSAVEQRLNDGHTDWTTNPRKLPKFDSATQREGRKIAPTCWKPCARGRRALLFD